MWAQRKVFTDQSDVLDGTFHNRHKLIEKPPESYISRIWSRS
jgi:hypothetical protein